MKMLQKCIANFALSFALSNFNLQTLMVEIYKTINRLKQPYMREIFIKKEASYDYLSEHYVGSQL